MAITLLKKREMPFSQRKLQPLRGAWPVFFSLLLFGHAEVFLVIILGNGPYERLFSSFSFFWPLIIATRWTIPLLLLLLSRQESFLRKRLNTCHANPYGKNRASASGMTGIMIAHAERHDANGVAIKRRRRKKETSIWL